MVGRRDILSQLEKELQYPVGAIVYHDKYDIEDGDEDLVSIFFPKFKTDRLALILHGEGGLPQSALAMAITLRQKFRKIMTIVPEIGASAMGYIWLISNKGYFCSNRVARQVNIHFKVDGFVYNPCSSVKD